MPVPEKKNTIASLQDVIETLKKENKEYQESQTRFKTVFENSRLGNKIISSELKILQVNPAMVELLGYTTKDEIIGSKILDYAPDYCHHDWEILRDKLWQKSTTSFSLETCLLKRNGTLIWCQVTSILFPDNGETLGYTIIEDVTERHLLRVQKEEFISVASHELKTPITTLILSLQLMDRKMNIGTVITEDMIKLRSSADKNATKLSHLVNDLLNSTKIDHGQFSLNKSTFVMADVIDGCCTHVRLEGKYTINYTGDHSLIVYADQYKIDQVLVNFVNNAVKYSPESLEILINVEKIPGFTKVTVTDHGRGIAADNISKLFNRYYRIGTEHHYASGLGLGLYISSEIIKKHGGEIGVDSVIGKGSSFWFTIPDDTSNNI
jgi:PAS domain S-box-containing protein